MTRGVFIAGNESSLYSAVAVETAKRVTAFASAIIPNRFPPRDGGLPPRAEASGSSIPLSWNPASPISARTLVLAAENRLGQINDAILICSPPAVFRTAEGLEPEEIEIFVVDHIKGWFFLIRELVLYFRGAGAGSLSFVAPEIKAVDKNTPADLLGPPAATCFMNFASGILSLSANEPFQVMGFSGSETSDKGEFAAWLFKIIDESSRKYTGKWNRFSKYSFFR